jgi:hypothetical protein
VLRSEDDLQGIEKVERRGGEMDKFVGCLPRDQVLSTFPLPLHVGPFTITTDHVAEMQSRDETRILQHPLDKFI